MKTLLLSALLCIAVSQAQSFADENHIIEGSIGLGLYGVTYEEEDIFGKKVTHRNGAGSTPIRLGYEYAINDWLGLGAMLQFQPFIDSSGADLTVTSIEIAPVVNFHFLRTEKLDWYAGLALGFSSFHWQEKDRDNPFYQGVVQKDVKATGSFVALQTGLRLYFGGRFGMNFGLAYQGLSYNEGDYSDNVGNRVENNPLPLRAKGMVASIGVQYRIGQ